jgi:hypothetical protein
MKVKKKKNPLIFWLPARTCCINVAISLCSLKNLKFQAKHIYGCLSLEQHHKIGKKKKTKKKKFLPYFEYRQSWQNIFMDDCHLSKATKLDYKRKN